MTTTKQIVIRIKVEVSTVRVRSYKLNKNGELKPTNGNEEYHVRDVFQKMDPEQLGEVIEEYVAEARYCGFEASAVVISAKSFEQE